MKFNLLPKELLNTADDMGGQQPQDDPNDSWEDFEENDEPGDEQKEEQEESEGDDAEEENQETEFDVTITKSFSKRLREETEKIRAEKDREIAKLKSELLEKDGAISSAEMAALEAYRGQLNPYNNKPIQSVDDIREYQAAYQKDMMSRSGIDDGYIERLVNQRLEQEIQKQRQMHETQRQAEEALQKDVLEIGKMNPNIKTADDLNKLPAEIKQAMDSLFFSGQVASLSLAYKLAAGSQKPAQNQNTKDHLMNSGRGNGGSELRPDAETMTMYKRMNPGVSDKEIIAHYNKNKKGG